jgi:hypothetical protein
VSWLLGVRRAVARVDGSWTASALMLPVSEKRWKFCGSIAPDGPFSLSGS